MWGNVPDDWNMYYRKCPDCGGTYHESEGGCGCYEERREEFYLEAVDRLSKATIDEVEHEAATYAMTDELGDDINKHCLYARIYLSEKDGCDELIFSESNWDEIKAAIGYIEPEEE